MLYFRMRQDNRKLIRQLKSVEGQVYGLQGMILKDMYCIDIVTQTSAARRAISDVEDVLLKNYLSRAVLDQAESGDENKMVREILKVYQLKRR